MAEHVAQAGPHEGHDTNDGLRFPRPRVAVITPTYNRAALLPRAIESVLAQTLTDWELLIVDDGSSDNTTAVVAPYVAAHANIRYLLHQNRGAGLARNAGMQATFGHYIAFLDSDDAYMPEHLASRVAYLDAHPEVDLIQGGFLSDEEIMVRDYFNPTQFINLRACALGPTFVGRRNVFVRLGGFRDLPFNQDTDLWQRALSAGFRTADVDHPRTYIYTQASDSITRQRSAGLL